MMPKRTTYTKITAKIIISMLIITLISSFFYGEYVKKSAIENLAQVDARKTSLLVFETLYAAMAKGWNKDELNTIITRLNNVDEKLSVNVYRSTLVAKLFGDIQRDQQNRENDQKIQHAMAGNEILDIKRSEMIDYYYPVVAKQECLKCHVNANVGNVLGVIHISYPVNDLKISLSEMINFFLTFIVVFSLFMFVALFINFQKYLLKPIKDFVNLLDVIKQSKDIKRRVAIEDNIEEIHSMQDVFNGMLDSIEKQFYSDSLTHLKNRHALLEAVDHNVESLLMILNVDRFQELNNLYGNEAGDQVLIELASFLVELLPRDAQLYRLQADEFAYLSTGNMDLEEFQALASYLIQTIEHKNFSIDEKNSINLSVTIGISFGAALILPHADIALKMAKKEKKSLLTYDESMQAKQAYELNFNWTKRLNQAVDDNHIIALYQPIVDSQSGEIVKYECLMRMEDDNHEYISPIHFLELAKKNKIYHKLTKAVLTDAFNSFRESTLNFSVNLSVEDILNEDITHFIVEELRQNTVSSRIDIEIIESEGIENFDAVLAFIEEVKQYGAKISIDDFGTGYSNFEYLLRLKVDNIKIDGSMIKNIATDENSRMVVQTIVDFAKKIGISTTAEYVYSREIFDTIKEMGIDYAQGYYFGQPTKEIQEP